MRSFCTYFIENDYLSGPRLRVVAVDGVGLFAGWIHIVTSLQSFVQSPFEEPLGQFIDPSW
jgi:hypothetical protein